jgi:hypothetical protein
MAALEYKIVGIVVGVIAIAIALIQRAFRIKYDHREPPIVSSGIPLIGHLLGMIRNGTSYIDALW